MADLELFLSFFPQEEDQKAVWERVAGARGLHLNFPRWGTVVDHQEVLKRELESGLETLNLGLDPALHFSELERRCFMLAEYVFRIFPEKDQVVPLSLSSSDRLSIARGEGVHPAFCLPCVHRWYLRHGGVDYQQEDCGYSASSEHRLKARRAIWEVFAIGNGEVQLPSQACVECLKDDGSCLSFARLSQSQLEALLCFVSLLTLCALSIVLRCDEATFKRFLRCTWRFWKRLEALMWTGRDAPELTLLRTAVEGDGPLLETLPPTPLGYFTSSLFGIRIE